MSKLTKTIKELTGEDPIDMFGGDAKNVVEELKECLGCKNCFGSNTGHLSCSGSFCPCHKK